MSRETASAARLALAIAITLALTMGVALVAGAAAAASDNATANDTDVEPDNETIANDTDADTDPDDGERDDGDDVDGDTDSDELEESLTLAELRQEGRQYSGSPDSVRIADDRMWWVVHWPAGEIGTSPGNDDNWRYLGADERVDRNAVWLRTIQTADETESVTAVVATYRVEDQEITEGNTTTTETIATDVRVDTHDLSYGPGWPLLEVPLRQADDTREVSIWLVDDDGDAIGDARWHFEHRSVATTQDAGITSEGDYLTRAGLEFVAPSVLGIFAIGGVCKRAIDRAARGPMWGYGKWLALLTFALVALISTQFNTLAELLTIAPYAVAAFLVGIAGIVILETYSADTKRTLFYRPVLRDAVSPSGEEAVDSMLGDMREELVVEGNGAPSVIRPGLIPFLARVFGARAVISGYHGLETAIKLPSSKWDQLVIVHPDAADVLEYEPEGFTLETPQIADLSDGLRLATIALIGAGGVWLIAATLSTLWAVVAGLVATVVYLATPTGGTARVEPAPGHLRAAFMSMMFLELELCDAETIEQAREQIIQLQAKRKKDVDAALEAQDATLIEEMHDGDVSRQIDTGAPSTSATRSRTGDDVDDRDQEPVDQEVPADD